LLLRQGGQELIVKAPMGSGLLCKARQKTLQREFRVYRCLQGIAGIPQCFGMIDGRYLVLEYVHGTGYRDAIFPDREQWFAALFEILGAMHSRGVAHGDLKSKSNLLVTADGRPCVIDFGTAVIYRAGFHPLNHWLFRLAKRLDINAWVKHKYHGRYLDASAADRELLDYGWIEILVRKLSGRPLNRVIGRGGRNGGA